MSASFSTALLQIIESAFLVLDVKTVGQGIYKGSQELQFPAGAVLWFYLNRSLFSPRRFAVKAEGLEPEFGFAFGQARAFGGRFFASFLFAEPFCYDGPEFVGLDGGCFSCGGGVANFAVGADNGEVCRGGAVEYSLFDDGVAIGIAAGEGDFQIT